MKPLNAFMLGATLALLSGCETLPAQTASKPTLEESAYKPFEGLFASISETRKFVFEEADIIWPGLAEAPFGILLIHSEGELLLCDPRTPAGFKPVGVEPTTGCPAATGPSTWRKPTFLAAMPAFGPPSVVVIGTPANTGKSHAEWKNTLIHEHFHQWQSALPGYYERVAALDLSGGDETGMWMLNYPFPYDRPEFVAAFVQASSALASALNAPKGEEFDRSVGRYVLARRAMQRTVSAKDWRYFEFQLWQEGVARWTEVVLGGRHPDPAARAAALNSRQEARALLEAQDIVEAGRLAVYSYGFAEASLLERLDPDWRSRYPEMLSLGPLFPATMNP